MDGFTITVFIGVYLGMILGGVPGLALDRTGVALVGAIVLVAAGRIAPQAAWDAVDVPTMGLLFGLMVVSAQFRLGGFYAAVTRRIGGAALAPRPLLGAQMAVAAALAAVLSNDVVCLAMAPVVAESSRRRRQDPIPYLIGLACAANIGSAATLIGNPQNMLIGQALGLSFAGYLADALVPAAVGTALAWAVLARHVKPMTEPVDWAAVPEPPPFNPWQTAKGALALAAVVAAFLVTDWPRDVVALGAAGLLLMSRKMHTRNMLGLVDWHVLVLFGGLFAVNAAFETSGGLKALLTGLAGAGIDLEHPGWLFTTSAVMSNLVSNVPATMLLLPAASHPHAGAVLALSSTLAGNLLIVGSIANIIVVEQARLLGIRIDWRTHARAGIPVTVLSLAVAALWLWLRAAA